MAGAQIFSFKTDKIPPLSSTKDHSCKAARKKVSKHKPNAFQQEILRCQPLHRPCSRYALHSRWKIPQSGQRKDRNQWHHRQNLLFPCRKLPMQAGRRGLEIFSLSDEYCLRFATGNGPGISFSAIYNGQVLPIAQSIL